MRTREEVLVELKIVEDLIVKNEQALERQDLSGWDKRDIKFENRLLEQDRKLLKWFLSKEGEINSNKEVNILELASELADLKLRETFIGEIYVETEDEVYYTEDAQDYFNELYDEYYKFLISF